MTNEGEEEQRDGETREETKWKNGRERWLRGKLRDPRESNHPDENEVKNI